MKLNRKGILAIILCMVTLLAVAAPALAAEIRAYATVTAATTNVYSTATKATVIGTFAKGDVVAVEATNGSLYKVRQSGSTTDTGYIEQADVSSVRSSVPSGKSVATMKAASGTSSTTTSSDTTTTTTSSTASGRTGTINTQTGLFKTASSSNRLTTLAKGVSVTVTGESGSYYKVISGTREGYVEKSKVTFSSSGSSSSGSSLSSVVGSVKVMPGSSSPLSSVSTAMATAKSKNSDTIGYIKLAGTKIDFPILHSSSNPFYYLTYDINKKKTSAAAVNSLSGVVVRNNTITAHNMRVSGTMFHELHHLQEKAIGKSNCMYSKCKKSLSSYPNMATDSSARIWDVTLFGYNKWEVWAMYEVPKNEPKSTLTTNYNTLNSYSTAQRQAWIDKQLSRSQLKFGTEISPDDIILTIYTCGDNYDSSTAQSRLYFFLKAVQ